MRDGMTDFSRILNSTAAPVLITGGAGFIGTNLADRFLRNGRRVIVYDNLSRPGVERNLAWLRHCHGDLVQVEIADIRDRERLTAAVDRAGAILHFAAQVAVTTSLADPRHDFEVNALGTFNLLEAARQRAAPPPVLFASTNKVYGALPGLALVEGTERYMTADPAAADGVTEEQPLDFHSPYGCSKGAADQYAVDYARSYGLPVAVYRMSCIYGPHQFGTEDQGWVAHFLLAAQRGDTVTLYGNGKQVRDVLHVNDLADAYLMGLAQIDRLKGEAFNLGGGADNAVSLRQVLALISRLTREPVAVDFGAWRTGDQPWYVADSSKLERLVGWHPTIPAETGIEQLHYWLLADRDGPAGTTRELVAAAG